MKFFKWITALISLTTGFHVPICAAEDPRIQRLRINILNRHNEYRRRHSAQPLRLDSQLNNIAQNYAEELNNQNKFQHSHRAGVGENLYSLIGSPGAPSVYENFLNSNGFAPVDAWYAEVSLYPNKGDYTKWGHFTQLVWKGSNLLGVGIAGGKNNKVYIVANYKPPGNVQGLMNANVQAKPYVPNSSVPKPYVPNSSVSDGQIFIIIVVVAVVIVIVIATVLIYTVRRR